MDFSETKQADRDASEYYPDHCHTDKGGSKMHPIHSPADSCQHPVLKCQNVNDAMHQYMMHLYIMNPL